MRTALARRLAVPALALAIVVLPACDVSTDLNDFNVILQVEDVPVDLGAGVTASIRPDEPTVSTTEVSTNFDVSSIDDLRSITLRPEMFSFTAGVFARSGSGAGAPPSGTITGFVFIDGYPVPGIPVVVTVADGAVTDVTPGVIALSSLSVDAAAINAFLDSLPASERPPLEAWESLSADEIRAIISTGISDGRFSVTVGYIAQSADSADPLVGSITLDEIDISAVVTR